MVSFPLSLPYQVHIVSTICCPKNYCLVVVLVIEKILLCNIFQLQWTGIVTKLDYFYWNIGIYTLYIPIQLQDYFQTKTPVKIISGGVLHIYYTNLFLYCKCLFYICTVLLHLPSSLCSLSFFFFRWVSHLHFSTIIIVANSFLLFPAIIDFCYAFINSAL